MKKTLLAAAISAGIAMSAFATDQSSIQASGAGLLQNNYVRAGVNKTTGTLGSGGNTSPGLLYDKDGTGTFNTSYDYLTPGSPFDGFAVKIDGTNYTNNNDGTLQIAGNTDHYSAGAGTALYDMNYGILKWYGGVTGKFNIEHFYILGATSQHIEIESKIYMQTAATDVYFGRFIDPDARAASGDSSATDNVLGYGVIPNSNVAFSEATVSRYALGLYSTDSNVDAGITSPWSSQADGYTSADSACGTGVTYCNGDDTIGLSWHWSSVASGDTLTASYAYIFGPTAFGAANTAMTAGAGGGDTTTTSSWGTLTDVGAATTAAAASSTPTVVSTSDPFNTNYGTWSAWTYNSALPVLTQSQTTHSASDDGKVQTIDRETTTIVTTPEKRTRTYDVAVTETLSNSTTRDVTTCASCSTGNIETAYQNTAVTTVTDPGSFVGRIDQAATTSDVVNSALRVADFTQVNGVMMDNKYNNGMTGTTRGVVAGGVDIKENNIIVGAGVARLNTAMTGNGDSADAETTAVSGVIGKRTERGDVTARLTHGMTDYTMSRTIGDFANAGATKGTDTSISLRFEGSERAIGKANVKPILGVTKGKRVVDSYTETGSIQSARNVGEVTDDYSYATLGASIDVGLVNLVALHNTDGVNDISLGVEKETEKVTWGVRAHRTTTDLGDTNSVSLGVSIKF